MDAKECLAKDAKHSGQCTEAEKAKCDMMKASMTKTGMKACCKAKGAEAKADVKKEKSSDAKGTN